MEWHGQGGADWEEDDVSNDADSADQRKPFPATSGATSSSPSKTNATSSDESGDDKKMPTKKRKRMSSNERWEEMFKRLTQFRDRNNHCSVPNRYPEDPSLGCWVSTQRRHYKKAKQRPGEGITPERAARLNALGFEWTGENPRHKNWDIRFAELKEFKAKYGHAQVPIGFEDNIQLANWTSTQEYKNLIKGKPSRLNENRIQLLESIGFVWELQRGGRRRRVTVTTQGAIEGEAESGYSSNAGGFAKAGVKKLSGEASKIPARSTSLVLPGVAILGGDQDERRTAVPPSADGPAKRRGKASVSRASAERGMNNNTVVEASQLKPPPPAPPNTHDISSATAGSTSHSNAGVYGNQFEVSSGVMQQANTAHAMCANSVGNRANLQGLARVMELPSGAVNHNPPISNLTTYQRALAILANQQDLTSGNASMPASNHSARLGARLAPPSAAQIHSLIVQQSSENERLRHELAFLSRQPNFAQGLSSTFLLQAASALPLLQPQAPPSGVSALPLLQPQVHPPGAAMMPALQAAASDHRTHAGSTRPESKTDGDNDNVNCMSTRRPPL